MRASIIASALFIVAACGSSSSPTTPSTPPTTLTGGATDSAGDAAARAGVPISPDLVSSVIDVSGGVLRLTVSFAPGTLSRAQIRISVFLDTDDNPNTGSPGLDGGNSDRPFIGSEYSIEAVIPPNSTQALIMRALGPNQFTSVGVATVSFPADEMAVGVPMALLGNDDGRLTFKVTAAYYLSETTATVTDYMPNIGLPGATVR